jgi:transposase
MALAFLTMSGKELDRAEWMLRIQERRVTQAQVAEHLGLSVRQVERLYRTYKAGGHAALISKKRGRPSPRKLPSRLRERVLGLVRERYADFGPTLAHEKLVESHGVKVSVETLRQWMMAEGIWRSRSQRAAPAHPPRGRRACLGELVQIDGCDHEWFEARAPRCTLLVYVDDATSRLMQLRFAESESTFSYFEATRRYLEQHGRPVAFYSDKAGIFRINAKQPQGGSGVTQFARALGELNIDMLFAHSPQAKGRVERAHQTLQDRLTKELRLRGISTADEANAFAPLFAADYNHRFAREPQSPHDAHRPLRPTDELAQVLRWKEVRKLTQNLTVHYKRSLYLVEQTREALALRGKLVEVHETEDGVVRIRHEHTELAATAFRKDGGVTQQDIEDNKYLASILQQIQTQQLARDEQKLPTLTLRERRMLNDSIAQRRAGDVRFAAE